MTTFCQVHKKHWPKHILWDYLKKRYLLLCPDLWQFTVLANFSICKGFLAAKLDLQSICVTNDCIFQFSKRPMSYLIFKHKFNSKCFTCKTRILSEFLYILKNIGIRTKFSRQFNYESSETFSCFSIASVYHKWMELDFYDQWLTSDCYDQELSLELSSKEIWNPGRLEDIKEFQENGNIERTPISVWNIKTWQEHEKTELNQVFNLP